MSIMQELLLKEAIFGLVESGQKTSTLRKGKRDIKCGLLVFKMTENPNIQMIVNIVNIAYVPYGEISYNEALKEGYLTVEELRNVLSRIYGKINDDEIFTFVEFEKVKHI